MTLSEFVQIIMFQHSRMSCIPELKQLVSSKLNLSAATTSSSEYSLDLKLFKHSFLECMMLGGNVQNAKNGFIASKMWQLLFSVLL